MKTSFAVRPIRLSASEDLVPEIIECGFLERTEDSVMPSVESIKEKRLSHLVTPKVDYYLADLALLRLMLCGVDGLRTLQNLWPEGTPVWIVLAEHTNGDIYIYRVKSELGYSVIFAHFVFPQMVETFPKTPKRPVGEA
jgi:hypothetical protein